MLIFNLLTWKMFQDIRGRIDSWNLLEYFRMHMFSTNLALINSPETDTECESSGQRNGNEFLQNGLYMQMST